MKWYFQLDHHPLWDMDISSPPILADVNVDGKPMKVVAQPTKQGILYVFDRVTGKPVWPMPETPVEKGSVPGEWYSPTEPIPTKPPAYARNGVSLDDLIDFTPALHDAAVKTVSKYKIGPIFTPAVVSNINGPIATLTLGTAAGGTNWPGGSYDPETHNVYVYASNALLYPLSLVKTPAGLSDIDYVQGVDGQRVEIARGPGELAGADSKPDSAPAPTNNGPNPLAALYPGGLPLIKPPYGTISAINLDKGEIVWQIAHGETPDFVRNHPALKGLNIPRTGQPGYDTGTMVTKSLVVAGDGMVTTTADHPRGAMLRAYDKMTGKEVGRVFLPAPESGSPMTYMVNGKQYIVVAVSGGNYSGEYIAFSLPSVP
jgi:quinoprotein glucose dehydrogenase